MAVRWSSLDRVNEYYDPNDGWRPPPRRNRQRQSTFSVAMEALGGGLVIALIIVGLKNLLGW
jgi:hypothetical protein